MDTLHSPLANGPLLGCNHQSSDGTGPTRVTCEPAVSPSKLCESSTRFTVDHAKIGPCFPRNALDAGDDIKIPVTGHLLVDTTLLEKSGTTTGTETGPGGSGLSFGPKKVVDKHGHEGLEDTISNGACGCGCIGQCEFPELYNWESDSDDDDPPHGGDVDLVCLVSREASQHNTALQDAGVDSDDTALYSNDYDYQADDESQEEEEEEEDDDDVKDTSDDNHHYHYGSHILPPLRPALSPPLPLLALRSSPAISSYMASHSSSTAAASELRAWFDMLSDSDSEYGDDDEDGDDDDDDSAQFAVPALTYDEILAALENTLPVLEDWEWDGFMGLDTDGEADSTVESDCELGRRICRL